MEGMCLWWPLPVFGKTCLELLAFDCFQRSVGAVTCLLLGDIFEDFEDDAIRTKRFDTELYVSTYQYVCSDLAYNGPIEKQSFIVK